jgi:hypothetical protein
MESLDFNLHSKYSELINTINDIDAHLVRISLEAESQIKPRGNKKWSQEAIQCQKECVTKEISETSGKEERQFFCLCRVEEANLTKEKRARNTNSATVRFHAQETKTSIRGAPPIRRSGNQMQERKNKAANTSTSRKMDV